MGLVITRNEGESYYMIATEIVELGSYIEIKNVKTSSYDPINRIKHKRIGDNINAHKGILILREEVVEKEGGLEEVIKKIKAGNFQFHTKKYSI